MSLQNSFATRLKNFREIYGMTQTELANELGISRGSLSFYENGERVPDIDTLYKMSNYFNVSSDYLIGITDVKSRDTNILEICNYTGLSEKAVNVLNFYKDSGMICNTVNFLLESEVSSMLYELGYLLKDEDDDIVKSMCEEKNVDFDELKEIIVEMDNHEFLHILSKIEQYLKVNLKANEKTLSITESGKIISLSETDREYSKNLSFEDLLSIKTIKQSELINRVLLDSIIEKLKRAKEIYPYKSNTRKISDTSELDNDLDLPF